MIQEFDINLDLPLEDSYKNVTSYFEPIFDELRNEINNIYSQMVGFALNYAVKYLTWMNLNNILHKNELEYYSNKIGMEFHKVLLMQLFYEINAACTSVKVKIGNSNALFRTMDWDLPFLKKITFKANYYKDNKKLYSAIAWYGSVGQFTAMNDNYAISINYRRTNNGTLMENFRRCLNMNWPVSYALRCVFEQNFTFDQAKEFLSTAHLIAPTYYTIIPNISNNTQSLVIIRNPTTVTYMQENSDNLLIQTNHNQLEPLKNQDNIIYTFERQKTCVSILKTKSNFIDHDDVISNFMVKPIDNEETIYCCVVQPGFDITVRLA